MSDWMQELNALIDKAEAEGKWLFCSYQQLWFSPAALRAHNANDRFCWGAVNWQLRDQAERPSVSAMPSRPDSASRER